MAREDLKISSENGGTKQTTTIGYVNPEATNAQLASLASALNAFTDNVYIEANRITTVNVDTEAGGGVKPEPTLTLSKNTCTKAEVGTSASIATITTNSDGILYARYSYPMTTWEYAGPFLTIQEGETPQFMPARTNGENAQNTWPQIMYVGITETENFKGKEVAYTVTQS